MTVIKQIMQDRKMTQNRLSYMSRVPQSHISMILNGRLYPCPSWRLRISEALDLPESSLFSERRGEVIRCASDENHSGNY
jgi:transcriptional regulator with XRE-family HTH domain